jgi:hypothetical protein
MRRWTLAEIRQKIEQDLDIEAEDFVTPAELLAIINEGIDECEANIHKFSREDEYFLAQGSISLVQGTSEYSLPTDIYANKIKALIYTDGSRIYPIKRFRKIERFVDIEVIDQNPGTEDYQYVLMHNSAADGYKIRLSPTSRETRANGIKIWYIRNANRLSVDADICDIPEFVYYIIAFAKAAVLFKEGHPNATEAKMDLEKQKQLMQDTLGEMVPDEDNQLVADFSHYEGST